MAALRPPALAVALHPVPVGKHALDRHRPSGHTSGPPEFLDETRQSCWTLQRVAGLQNANSLRGRPQEGEAEAVSRGGICAMPPVAPTALAAKRRRRTARAPENPPCWAPVRSGPSPIRMIASLAWYDPRADLMRSPMLAEDTTFALTTRLTRLAEECVKNRFSDQADRVRQAILDLRAPLFVMVVGEGKTGKSTLINALLGRNVAPVHFIPKTWKVDLYDRCEDGGMESAELHRRSTPSAPVAVSIEEARRLCDEEEQRVKGGEYRSDLYQARWRLRIDWPRPGVAMVDTPGLRQLRGDLTGAESVNLYGGDGFVVQAEEPFRYWYARADVVLWCINSTRLHDQDALDLLRDTRGFGKRIVGVLTHSDKLPPGSETQALVAAREVFGEHIEEFILSAAGSSNSEARATSVQAIRARVDSWLESGPALLKRESMEAFASAEEGQAERSLDAIMLSIANNIGGHDKAVAQARTAFSDAVAQVRVGTRGAFEKAAKTAHERLPSLWAEAGGDPQRCAELVEDRAVDLQALNAEVNAIVRLVTSQLEVTETKIRQAVEWEGASVGGRQERRTAPAGLPATRGVALTLTQGAKARVTGQEGAGVALGVSVGVGMLAGAALGPLGLLAVPLAHALTKGEARKHETLAKARAAVQDLSARAHGEFMSAFAEAVERQFAELCRDIDGSFRRFHGDDATACFARLVAGDESLSRIYEGRSFDDVNVVSGSVLRPMLDDGAPRLTKYAWKATNLSPLLQDRWEGAFDKYWQQLLNVSFLSTLARAGSPLSPASRALTTSQHGDKLFSAMRERVKRGEANSTRRFRSGDLVSSFELIEVLRGAVPGFDNLVDSLPASHRDEFLALPRVAQARVRAWEGAYSERVRMAVDEAVPRLPDLVLEHTKWASKAAIAGGTVAFFGGCVAFLFSMGSCVSGLQQMSDPYSRYRGDQGVGALIFGMFLFVVSAVLAGGGVALGGGGFFGWMSELMQAPISRRPGVWRSALRSYCGEWTNAYAQRLSESRTFRLGPFGG